MTIYILGKRNLLLVLIFSHLLIIISLLSLTAIRRAFLAMIMNFVYLAVLILGFYLTIRLSIRIYIYFLIALSISILLSICVMFIEAFAVADRDQRDWIFYVNLPIIIDIAFDIVYIIVYVQIRKHLIKE